jgi:hypothetical protein
MRTISGCIPLSALYSPFSKGEEAAMTVRIKEIVLRYEDDGEETGLSAEQHKAMYRPLHMDVHHHCAPASQKKAAENAEKRRMRVDLSQLPDKA